jgi:GNAT superfamily N-acetyltransferase
MALATWWNSDQLPNLLTLPGLRAGIAFDDAVLARLNRIPIDEVLARRLDGHRPYIAHMHGTSVAYGWVATREASIGELKVTMTLPRSDRYLWDFATLPEWQGRGIYPRLLQAIFQQESSVAERFWIIYAPENLPSGAGMRKAGFLPVAELSFDADRNVGLAQIGAIDRAQAAAKLLGMPLVESPLAPCWCCQSGQMAGTISGACWPPSGLEASACTCAIEHKPAARLVA